MPAGDYTAIFIGGMKCGEKNSPRLYILHRKGNSEFHQHAARIKQPIQDDYLYRPGSIIIQRRLPVFGKAID